MMEVYGEFARVYDLFMEQTLYENWIDYILKIWKKYELEPKYVLDLCCGTGTITTKLYERGYDVIGIDFSEEMLCIAQEKALETNSEILYLKQDIREFELYGTVESIICLCDSLNYILDYSEIFKIFKLVNNYLSPDGIFIFDINTEYKYKNILADNTFSEAFEEGAYIWENYYNTETKINEYNMDFFIKCNNGYYERFEEIHKQKAHSMDKTSELLESSGLKILDIYDAFTFNIPTENSERVCFVARECLKNKVSVT